MKIHIPNDSKEGVGGAWTFKRNLEKYVETVDNPKDADITLVAGATMIERDTFQKCRDAGKVVLRIDGFPEDWRNRGTGWPRLRDFYMWSDAIVCQSDFVCRTTHKYLQWATGQKRPCRVIHNGVDHGVFSVRGAVFPRMAKRMILGISSRKDPNKRLEEVLWHFRDVKAEGVDAFLTIVGKVPKDYAEYGLGLYGMEHGKEYQYLGVVDNDEEMAKIYRSHDEFWFPSFADPCPNVVLEAMACGMKVMFLSEEGASREIVVEFQEGEDMSINRMAREYSRFLIEVINWD